MWKFFKKDIDTRQNLIQNTNNYPMATNGIICARCNCSNVNIQMQTISSSTVGKSETVKKGVIERAGNKIGRTGMIMATGGLWALTPKKSKYKEVSTHVTNCINRKVAICQNCGNSWYL